MKMGKEGADILTNTKWKPRSLRQPSAIVGKQSPQFLSSAKKDSFVK